jgi:hypothetical protein
MNFDAVVLAFFFVGAAIFSIFMIAGANQNTITDTFGAVQGNTTNSTMATVTNTTAPLMGGAGGLAIIIAVFIIFLAAVFVVKAAFGHSSYNTGRR